MARKPQKHERTLVKSSNINPDKGVSSAPDGLFNPANPRHRWDRPLQAPGRMQVDFEERVDFRRLHDYRLARTRNALSKSKLGALLVFDQYNMRYISSTVIGEWARDKLTRWTLLTGNGEPWVWDFGSAARHHKIYAPWLPKNHCLAGNVGLRGAINPRVGLFDEAAKEIYDILVQEGVADMPLGVDVVEPPFLFALQKLGLKVQDGQQVMLEAREIKSVDEITLLNMAAAMGDGVYQDIFEALKPGVRENEIVALATKRLYEMGSDCVEAINAIAGERCSPHPHNFTDRMIRPGDQAYFDIIQSYIRLNDVEVRLVAGADHAVGEIMRMRAAALAGDRVDRFDAIGAHFIQPLGRERDDFVFAHARLQSFEDVLVDAVAHCRRHVEQRNFVNALDFARFEHDLLAILHFEPEFLQREQKWRLDDVDAERHVGNPFLHQDVVDFFRRFLEQADARIDGAAQSDVAGEAVIRRQPRR